MVEKKYNKSEMAFGRALHKITTQKIDISKPKRPSRSKYVKNKALGRVRNAIRAQKEEQSQKPNPKLEKKAQS